MDQQEGEAKIELTIDDAGVLAILAEHPKTALLQWLLAEIVSPIAKEAAHLIANEQVENASPDAIRLAAEIRGWAQRNSEYANAGMRSGS